MGKECRPFAGDPEPSARWRAPSRTTLNYILDALLLTLFLWLAFVVGVTEFVFPAGDSATATLWGGTLADWRRIHFATFCTLTVGILLHLMLHWNWICSVTNTHVLGRKPGRDDGGRTLIGVGVLIALLHVLAIALIAARLMVKLSGAS